MEVADDSMGDGAGHAMARVEHPPLWEENFKRAAASYGQSFKALKDEAIAFLEDYKKMHPTCNVGLDDLMVLEKPNPDILQNLLAI